VVMMHAASGLSCPARFAWHEGNCKVAVLMSADTGVQTARYEYGPFGEPVRVTGLATSLNPFRFSSKRTCNTTELVLYEYRAYQPSTGRWPNRDPLGEWGGVNLYAAMGNQLVNLIDALGLECVGHTCQPGQPPGYDEDGLHFCGPPSPLPPPRPHDLPGYNRVPPYNPPDDGKPCCVDPAVLKKAKRTDPPPTEGSKRSDGGVNWTIHMKLDLQIDGPYKDLQIYWTTCWRIDGTSGIIPTCSNKTACDFLSITYGNIGGPYTTQARIFWLSCEGGKWTKKKHIVSGGYTFNGKWDFEGATN